MTEETPSSNDPKKLAAQKQGAKDREKQERADLAAVLEMDGGRRFVRRLLIFCGEHRSSFSQNAITMAFNEGHRNVALMLKAAINDSAPNRLLELLARDAETQAPRSGRERPQEPTE